VLLSAASTDSRLPLLSLFSSRRGYLFRRMLLSAISTNHTCLCCRGFLVAVDTCFAVCCFPPPAQILTFLCCLGFPVTVDTSFAVCCFPPPGQVFINLSPWIVPSPGLLVFATELYLYRLRLRYPLRCILVVIPHSSFLYWLTLRRL
jgi:hypothetical protein